ncbi:MAG: S24 family peptidase, partial [Sphingomonadaceae bacterium]
GLSGYFDDRGFPVGAGWEEVAFPGVSDEKAYALEIAGSSMLPLYREGDIVIVSPTAAVRRGDRVVVKTTEGEMLAKQLRRETAKSVELASLNPEHPDRVLALSEIAFMARVIWASQ